MDSLGGKKKQPAKSPEYSKESTSYLGTNSQALLCGGLCYAKLHHNNPRTPWHRGTNIV